MSGAQGPGGSASEAWQLMASLVLDNQRRRSVADSTGLSFGKTRALRRIAREPRTMRQVAELLGVDPPYLTLMVDDLERRGLVERRPHPTDRRAKLVVATPAGHDAARQADDILATPPDGLAALGADDLADLVRILGRVSERSPAAEGSGPAGTDARR